MRALDHRIAHTAREYGRRQSRVSRQSLDVCLACRARIYPESAGLLPLGWPNPLKRSFSSTTWRFDGKRTESPVVGDNGASGPVHAVPDEHLPSHRERSRYTLSKKTHAFLDDLMQKLAVATQRINNYTGTDYSGIEGLRREIKFQEQLVKSRRDAVQEAKSAQDNADTQRVASQKEVVALLERKSSWTSGDLERYMGLIRSEHAHDQAVQAAKDNVVVAERALEEARLRLEKRERAQYHEEQIWSDTIRRNSTWVTFGLMGLNILLLLGNLVVIEPWRRKRMVNEMKQAMQERATPAVLEVERIKDEVIETTPVLELQAALEEVTTETAETATPISQPNQVDAQPLSIESVKDRIRELFSDRIISIKQIDLTMEITRAIIGGAAVASTVIILSTRK